MFADGLLKNREGDSQVEEGGGKHVPADSRRAIEVEMGGRHG